MVVDIDYCFSQPCQNGGSCYNSVGYKYLFCSCPSQYTGTYCESKIISLLVLMSLPLTTSELRNINLLFTTSLHCHTLINMVFYYLQLHTHTHTALMRPPNRRFSSTPTSRRSSAKRAMRFVLNCVGAKQQVRLTLAYVKAQSSS